MTNKSGSNHIKLGTIIIIMIITAIISGITSGVIVYSSYDKNTGISYKTISDDPSLKEFLEVYSQVTSDYYKDVNKSELIKTVISSMLEYLGDDYTTYLDKDQTNKLDESLQGEYRGIGILIQEHKIVQVFEDSPAEAAGLKENDEIIKINNVDVKDKSGSDIASTIKSSKDTEVSITVLRDEKEITTTIQLSRLYVPAISYDVIENTNIGYIGIATFSSTVDRQVENAINKLKKQNINSLIIDLRGNSGGFLSAAESVSNIFLERGKVIYTITSKNSSVTMKDTTESKTDYKIIVLIDENTASAAEIFAAALKDSYGATIVGKHSFGKGSVQQTYRLNNGAMAKYTSAHWFRPNGESVESTGIIPDYDVDLTLVKDKDGNVTSVKDTQFDKAVELLN